MLAAGDSEISLQTVSINSLGIVNIFSEYRQNLRCHGVSVHIMEPGFFKTNLITFDESRLSEIRQHYHSLPEETKREVGEPFVDTCKFALSMEELYGCMQSFKCLHAAKRCFR